MIALWLVRRLTRSPSGGAWPGLDSRLGPVTRAVAATAVAASVAGAGFGTPRPGASGAALGVSLAMAAALLAGLYLAAADPATPWPVVASALVLGLAAATLAGFDPNSPGYVGAFIAVGALALRIGGAIAVTCGLALLVALTLALVLARAAPQPAAIASIDLGMFFVFATATFAREQQRLLRELREAQEARAQAAALQERARLAREIHDVLAHSLTGLTVQLEGARLLLSRERADGAAVVQVERAQRLARSGLDEARQAVRALRGDTMPGPEQLAALAAEFEAEGGPPCRLEVDGESRPLAPEARLALYRAAQEALTNVRKHSAANTVLLHLAWREREVDLVVEDRGAASGAEAGGALASTGGGFGLAGIRERAELLGGSLDAAPTGAGFRVHLRLPA
ncbi:MAG: two-component sensor histidine kinase [Candidatus Dormibacteraeota bacterium]|nr:two-component sensor histidine kinase [Candidatus Dormibacteraeota bacterium]MBV9526624.1 two-component sensor histidine kinase [Candidatus Dormibacteraeota bacterium]